MSMLIKTLLASLALGVGGTPRPQDPSTPPPPEPQVAPPAPAPAMTQTHLWVMAPQGAPELQKKVTVAFEAAPLSDVLRWVKSQGLNFAVAPDAGFANRKLTLSVRGVPISDVLEAIAEAYGGEWVQRGPIQVLSNRGGIGVSPRIASPADLPLRIREMVPRIQSEQHEAMRRAIEIERKSIGETRRAIAGSDAMKVQIEKALEMAHKELQLSKGAKSVDSKALEAMQKSLEEAMRSGGLHEQALDELSKLRGMGGVLSPEALAKMRSFEVELQGKGGLLPPEALKELSKMKIELQGKGGILPPEALKELAKLKELGGVLPPEALKELSEMKIELQGKGGVLPPEALKELAKLKEMRAMPKLELKRLEGQPGRGVALSVGGMKQLVDTLSKKQRALHKKQGFLRVSDLTASQRKLLGETPEGDWSITIRFQGKDLTLRGG